MTGGQKNGQSGGQDFSFSNFIFYKLECRGGKVKIKIKQERRYEIRRASTLVGGETKYQNVYDQRD